MKIVNEPFTTTFHAFPINELKDVFTNLCVNVLPNKIASCVVFNTRESVVYCLHVDELVMSTLFLELYTWDWINNPF